MGHIETTTTLSSAPDAVWRVISDPSTWDSWFTIHERWMEEPPAELTEGAHLTAKIVMLGMANKIEWTVGELVGPTKMVLRGTGMAGVKTEFVFTLAPAEGGSALTVTGDFEGALLKGALSKAVEKDARSQIAKTFEKLDALASA
ncbi:SRPBCC family protein [Gordonia sp. PDNC005]|jgi:carbon monoxide dehydrogenase subunit G|uniref:type II toxin-antitoxin system Rv0910 family toxin n=1 Tax=unclassified Gordonia (in: high G+C Gram-positive bacteria) TaxID=2657482 RepID=UPI0019631C8E|nr:SRPBCC family protein [Gordonia sp. PDNC005]QRY61943.1 SRPBCC family protein [Gordonia sp. PDNC005]